MLQTATEEAEAVFELCTGKLLSHRNDRIVCSRGAARTCLCRGDAETTHAHPKVATRARLAPNPCSATCKGRSGYLKGISYHRGTHRYARSYPGGRYMSLCFYVLPAFLPSGPGGARHTHLLVKTAPVEVS